MAKAGLLVLTVSLLTYEIQRPFKCLSAMCFLMCNASGLCDLGECSFNSQVCQRDKKFMCVNISPPLLAHHCHTVLSTDNGTDVKLITLNVPLIAPNLCSGTVCSIAHMTSQPFQ